MPACLRVENFFFAGRPSDGYDFDAVDPKVDGDFSSPHISIIPLSLREEGFVELPGARVHWVFARHAEGPRTTVLFHHGNGPHLGRFWDRVEVLWQLGYDVMLFDYPGFGRSTGEASEANTEASSDAMLEALLDRDDIDPAQVVLYGHSLGGAVALGLAARAERESTFHTHDGATFAARGVVAESAWCSIEEMILDAAFLDIPRETLTRLRFDGCAHVRSLRTTPVMLLHGRHDGVVPRRQHTLLAQQAGRATTHVNDARHVDVMVVGGEGPDEAGVPGASTDYRDWMEAFARP